MSQLMDMSLGVAWHAGLRSGNPAEDHLTDPATNYQNAA